MCPKYTVLWQRIIELIGACMGQASVLGLAPRRLNPPPPPPIANHADIGYAMRITANGLVAGGGEGGGGGHPAA